MPNYLDTILRISEPYLCKTFSKLRVEEFLKAISSLKQLTSRDEVIRDFSEKYIQFIKEDFQT